MVDMTGCASLVMRVENALDAKRVRRVTRSPPDQWSAIRTTLRPRSTTPDILVAVMLHEDAMYDRVVSRALSDCSPCITTLHLTHQTNGFYDCMQELFTVLAGMPALQDLDLGAASLIDGKELALLPLARPTFRLRRLVLGCSFARWMILIAHSADTLVDLTLVHEEYFSFYELAADDGAAGQEHEQLRSCVRSVRHLRVPRGIPDGDFIAICSSLRSLACSFSGLTIEELDNMVQSLQRPLQHLTLQVSELDEETVGDMERFLHADVFPQLRTLHVEISWTDDEEGERRASERLSRWCSEQRIRVVLTRIYLPWL
ncbi:hypothetical protein EXIGLDRAFT_731898 [Exidia glandulosa HHB12029]|uniref:F-box domain-containing protein n=1 Tax=Exidia glandulosa HHB12029 TaxID=1314781 RepID=A0A165BQE8_EXIGL|nr:hypothetical protein EXIGLDRAFT_731898 [Exidia glandulosa HHB12029]